MTSRLKFILIKSKNVYDAYIQFNKIQNSMKFENFYKLKYPENHGVVVYSDKLYPANQSVYLLLIDLHRYKFVDVDKNKLKDIKDIGHLMKYIIK